MLLQIEHLHKHYGGVRALDDACFSLNVGEVLGLVGDNGAGKSTLLKCITGSELPDGGMLRFNGQTLVSGDPHETRLAGIEMIYQNLNLCGQQSVLSNIFLGRELRLRFIGFETPLIDLRAMERAVKALMSNLNSNIDIRKKTNTLSGGQQQAVAIARALLFQPKLLIMDEPTAALGIKEIAKVLDLIKSLKKQGIAVIIVSHRLADIFAVSDRVILMRHGKICEDKPVSELSLTELTHRILAE